MTNKPNILAGDPPIESHAEAISRIEKTLNNGGFNNGKKMLSIEAISSEWRNWYNNSDVGLQDKSESTN